jgi:hypothetical protein
VNCGDPATVRAGVGAVVAGAGVVGLIDGIGVGGGEEAA